MCTNISVSVYLRTGCYFEFAWNMKRCDEDRLILMQLFLSDFCYSCLVITGIFCCCCCDFSMWNIHACQKAWIVLCVFFIGFYIYIMYFPCTRLRLNHRVFHSVKLNQVLTCDKLCFTSPWPWKDVNYQKLGIHVFVLILYNCLTAGTSFLFFLFIVLFSGKEDKLYNY